MANMAPMIAAVAAVIGLMIGFAAAWWLRSRQARAELDALTQRLGAEQRAQLERATQDTHYAGQRLDESRARIERLEQSLTDATGARDALQTELAALRSTGEARDERVSELTRERDTGRAELAELRETGARLEARLATQAAEFDEQRKAMDEKLALLQSAEKQLNQQFENLANRIFETKSEHFRKTSADQLTQLLKPFREQIDGLHKDVREASKERYTLGKEIERIVSETNALTHALKGDSKRQGDWGELVLERILENSGLRRGEEYEVQSSFTTEDNGRLRPDVIVHLPEQRDIVIDSKVSLTAYERYVNGEDDAERAIQLKAHVQSMRRHVDELAAKRYDHIAAIRTLDYTLMWVPIEPAYFAAMQADPTLVNLAMEKRVIPICATTLFAVLKTIERIWQYERQTGNVEAVMKGAREIYDKFVIFTGHMDDIGKQLDRAQESYTKAHRNLLDGPGNVVRRLEKLRELGVAPKKRLPDDWVGKAGALDGPDEAATPPGE